MRDYDKEPLILENKFGKHMFFIAKLQIFFLISAICIVAYMRIEGISQRDTIKFSSLFLAILFVIKDYKDAYSIKQSKIVFYNFKIECIDKEKRILDYLRLDNITNIEVKDGVTSYPNKYKKVTEKERVQTIYCCLFFIYFPTFIFVYYYPVIGILIIAIVTSLLAIRTFGINLNKTNTLVIHSDEMLEPIQLVFLDKNEQNLLKEYFMKRCKRLIKFY